MEWQTCRSSSKTVGSSSRSPEFRKFQSTTGSLQAFRFKLRINCKHGDRSTTQRSAIVRAQSPTGTMLGCRFTLASRRYCRSLLPAADLAVAVVALPAGRVADREVRIGRPVVGGVIVSEC